MKRLLTRFGHIVIALLLLASTAYAQATVNSTTLAAAITSKDQLVINVTSATTMVVGQFLFVDNESMVITSFDPNVGTLVRVQRGRDGTSATVHASGTLIWSGPGRNFYAYDVSGPCTATQEIALPHINTKTGSIFDCRGATSTTQVWSRYAQGGIPDFQAAFLGGPAGTPPTYTSSGAITVMPGVQYIGSAGALAMTLAAPTTAQNGMIMILLASTAQAHTVTNTAGFGGGTTARDVATFGGAINDGFIFFANNGVWWVISTRNVTLG